MSSVETKLLRLLALIAVASLWVGHASAAPPQAEKSITAGQAAGLGLMIVSSPTRMTPITPRTPSTFSIMRES